MLNAGTGGPVQGRQTVVLSHKVAMGQSVKWARCGTNKRQGMKSRGRVAPYHVLLRVAAHPGGLTEGRGGCMDKILLDLMDSCYK